MPLVLALSHPSLLSRWMVVLTFWLLALAPALSRAMAGEQGLPLLPGQICSSSSNTGTGTLPGGDPLAHLVEHCPLCSLHGQQDLAPPPADAAPPALRGELRFAMPERFFSAAATGHGWNASLARAPPAAR